MRDLKPIIGYVHTGIEKTCEDKSYWKVIPFVERMDYLSYFFNTKAFCGARRDAARASRCPRARQYLRVIHLELNRIHVATSSGSGTTALDLGAISMLWYCFRERDTDPRPVRDVVRPAHAHALLPGRRRHRGHPRRLRARRSARSSSDMPDRVDQYEATCSTATRSSCSALRGRRHRLPESGCSSSASPARCCAPPANPGTCARPMPYCVLRRLRLQDPGRHRRRQLRPLPRCASPEMRESLQDHRAGARRPARGPVHHRRPQGRAAAAPRARDLDGGADPPLQARHRGLPRAAGRGLLPDRVAARRARLLRARRRLLEAGARAHARPVASSTCRRLATWSTGSYIADMIATLAMLDPILGGIDR